MKKSWFYLGAIGSLAILTSSCGDSKPAATPSPSTSPSAVASPAATAPTPAAPVAATTPTPTVATTALVVPGTKPTVPGTKPVSVDVAAGLIPPTDGENWAKTVAKGRPDPFASMALQPIEVSTLDPINSTGTGSKVASKSSAVKSGITKPLPTIKVASIPAQTPRAASGKSKIASKAASTAEPDITRDSDSKGNTSISSIPRTGINRALPKITVAIKPTNSSKSPAEGKVANNPQAPSNSKVVSNNDKVASNPVLRPVNIGATPSKTPSKTEIAARSERPAEKPLQAMAIQISGMIDVEGKTQVIVKLPNETFSRYVNVGSRIADSNILVKRVEDPEGGSPTIVLEEVGVEVSRKIGDKLTVDNTAPQSNSK
jgi:hypothetical protein